MHVRIGGTGLEVHVVKSFWAKAKGLMFRDALPEDGMLFIFSRPKTLDFWMMFMRFPIDIVFLDASGKVVAVHHNARPTLNPLGRIYSSCVPAKYALEVKAGFCKMHGVRKGSVALVSPGM